MSKKKEKNTHPPQKKPRRWSDAATGIVAIGVFVAVVFVMLLCRYGDYMHKIESLSIFLSVSTYFTNCMAVPGGLLTWMGTALTLTMHSSVAGAACYALMMLVVIVLCIKAFAIPSRWWSIAIVPAALIFIAFVNFGYLIYTVKPLGYAFSLPLGVALSLLLYWGIRVVRIWWLRLLALAAVVILGYPYLGFYALFAAVMGSIGCLHEVIGAGASPSAVRRILQLLPPLFGIALVVAVPLLWFWYKDGDLMASQIYISGLPRFFAREVWMKGLYSSVFVCLLLGTVVRLLPQRWLESFSHPRSWMQGAVCAVAIAAMVCMRYRDPNFMLGLKLDRLIQDGDYYGAVETAKGVDFKMTRANTLLSYIALIRTGQMGTMMCDIPYGWEPYATTRDSRSIFDVCGALAAYHLGMPNYAYRWGMEYTLEQGLTVERLKAMVKCALISGEMSLAKTYLDILFNVPTHRDWAKKYLRYYDNPIQLANDPEVQAIVPLMCHDNEFINDQGSLEGYIWDLLARAPSMQTPQFNELCMQAALIKMDLNAFISRLPAYASTSPRVPKVYQEAALLWSLLEKRPAPIEIDPMICSRHDEFLAAFRQFSNLDAEEQRDQMREAFDDTYWYYFIFMNDHTF